MNLRTIALLVVSGAAFATTDVNAETWNVTIGDNFYEPNDLTIQVGDTVRWTYSGSMRHDVTADDGSFASPTSSSIDYQRTFNSVGEILYYCTVHSTPGRDINVFQNGRINVVEAEPTFRINAGMSDAWFNPQTGGQGFFIIVWEGLEQIFLSWFTYDTVRPPEDATAQLGEPGHRWLTAQGTISGDTALLDIYSSSGGVFDAAEPPAVTDPVPVGAMVIQWSDCNTATLTYEIPGAGLSGEIPLQRIVSDNVPLCEAGQSTAQ